MQPFSDIRLHRSERNTKRVLSDILLHGHVPRTEIARRVGITQASVSRITQSLLKNGLIRETGHLSDEPRPGRKQIGIEINPDGGYFAGIAINAFRQDVVIANFANETIAEKTIRFYDLGNANNVLDTCANALNQLIDESKINRDLLISCGVAIAGAVDPTGGRLRNAPTLGWSDVPVQSILESALDLPVVMESIPNAKNLAARCFGTAKHADNVVLFNCSLAIGSSIVVDGHLCRGADSNVGLIETLLVPDSVSDGALKPLDSVAGGYSIIGESTSRTAVAKFSMAQNLMDVIKRDSNQIPGTERSLEEAGRGLAHAIITANAFLHPQIILLSGPLINSSIYQSAIIDEISHLTDRQFDPSRLKFFAISSQEAAHSLAIYHYLHEPGNVRYVAPESRRAVA